jgi:hypothetical protein
LKKYPNVIYERGLEKIHLSPIWPIVFAKGFGMDVNEKNIWGVSLT